MMTPTNIQSKIPTDCSNQKHQSHNLYDVAYLIWNEATWMTGNGIEVDDCIVVILMKPSGHGHEIRREDMFCRETWLPVDLCQKWESRT